MREPVRLKASRSCDRLTPHAQVTALGAEHALGAIAERADAYADCATKVMRSRALAKLLRHVLAAGNAVNAGSSKGGASAVKLSSLLAAARTKGADGKTTLLDGVVGLILDRAERKFNRDAALASDDTRDRYEDSGAFPEPLQPPLQPVRGDPFKDELLDFPECDGILAALDCARGADERAVAADTERFRRDGLAKLDVEVTRATLEFAPDDDDDAAIPVGHRGMGATEAAAPRPPRVVARTHAPFFLADVRDGVFSCQCARVRSFDSSALSWLVPTPRRSWVRQGMIGRSKSLTHSAQ